MEEYLGARRNVIRFLDLRVFEEGFDIVKDVEIGSSFSVVKLDIGGYICDNEL